MHSADALGATFARSIATISNSTPPPSILGQRLTARPSTDTMKKYMCLICGWIYDEALGSPDEGIAPGTKWEDVPPNWTCPECGARKEDFEMIEI